jgi:hypothetical protein
MDHATLMGNPADGLDTFMNDLTLMAAARCRC